MRNNIIVLILLASVGFSLAATETHDVTSARNCEELPVVVYVNKQASGRVVFSIVYREIAPFNSTTHIHIKVNGTNGERLFDGIIKPQKYIGEDMHRVVFSIDEAYLEESDISITSDWFPNDVPFPKYRGEEGRFSFYFDLIDLYEWNSEYGTIESRINITDARLIKLGNREDIGLERWKANSEIAKGKRAIE